MQEPDAAISAATQAIELRPKSFEGHFIRAKAYKDKGYDKPVPRMLAINSSANGQSFILNTSDISYFMMIYWSSPHIII